MNSISSLKVLEEKARQLRKHVIDMTVIGGLGHVGPSLSCADILACLYCGVMKLDAKNPAWEDRDRFILSAGHKGLALYSILAICGYFPEDTLMTYHGCDSLLGHHPVKGLPGVEIPTGSLGHGCVLAAGIALAGRMQNKGYRVFTLVGDGELDEGSVWEAARVASHYKLDNLVLIVDRNNLMGSGRTEDISALEPLDHKFEAFGWGVHTVDGHDMSQLYSALTRTPWVGGRPTAIIARTIKGRGVSFMENDPSWHIRTITPEQAEQALRELEDAKST